MCAMTGSVRLLQGRLRKKEREETNLFPAVKKHFGFYFSEHPVLVFVRHDF